MRLLKTCILFLLLTAPLLAQPQGRFLLGEFDGESFEFLINIEGETLTLETLEDEPWSEEIRLSTKGDGVSQFLITFPEEEPKPVTLIELSGDEIVFSSPTEGTVLQGFRLEPLPDWLQGVWRSRELKETIEFKGENAILGRESEQFETKVIGLAPRRNVARLALLDSDPHRESVLLHFALVEDTLLVWDLDDGKVKRFTR